MFPALFKIYISLGWSDVVGVWSGGKQKQNLLSCVRVWGVP